MSGNRVRWEVRWTGSAGPDAAEFAQVVARGVVRSLRAGGFADARVVRITTRRVEWTRVTDDPATWPEKGVAVLVTDDCGDVHPSYVTTRGWALWSKVVAWRPMPPPGRVKR